MGQNDIQYSQDIETLRALLPGKKLVLFGAGSLAMRCLNTILWDATPAYICDSSTRRQGKKLYGIAVRAPEALKEEDPAATVVLITAGKTREILETIARMGRFPVFFGSVLTNNTHFSVASGLFRHEKEIAQVTQMLCDDLSKRVYTEAVRRRMIGETDFSDLKIPGERQYIVPELFSGTRPKDEVVLDCGAFEGETTRKFISIFGRSLKKIYAFEPGRAPYVALARIARDCGGREGAPQIIPMRCGLSDEKATVSFYFTNKKKDSYLCACGEAACASAGNGETYPVETVRLDDVIPPEEKVTYIKMDIEGAEWQALHGARKILETHKPRLAVSLYHKGEDYWRIPLLLKTYVPDYRFCVRHHSRRHVDTVLYAWV